LKVVLDGKAPERAETTIKPDGLLAADAILGVHANQESGWRGHGGVYRAATTKLTVLSDGPGHV
jgi:hypothetical protein